jgi:ferredoxin
MPKTITVNQNTCIGCNTCPLIAPENFALDEKTHKAFVKKQPETPKENQQAQEALTSCPVSAISVNH